MSIHRSAIHKIVDPTQKGIKQKAFSLKFVKISTGEVIHIVDCVCTSQYANGRSMNVKILGSAEIRTIRTITIIEFNGHEVRIR